MYINGGKELPIYKIYGPNGHVWKIYLDGRLEGFPPDSVVINHAEDMLCRLLMTRAKQQF